MKKTLGILLLLVGGLAALAGCSAAEPWTDDVYVNDIYSHGVLLGGGGAEVDPVYIGDPAFGITAGDIVNWDTAFGWGDHAGLYVPYAGATGNVDLGDFNLSQGNTLTIHSTTADAIGAIFKSFKSRGAGTVVTGDILSEFRAYGYDGANNLFVGAEYFRATGTVAATRVPTQWEVWVGTDAAPSTLTKASALSSSVTAFGLNSLRVNTGGGNCAFGKNSLYTNSTGGGNSAFGSSALYTSNNNYNSAFGYESLYANTSGYNNAAFGQGSLRTNTTGGGNSAFGDGALYTNSTGDGNVGIGHYAGRYETGSNHLWIDNTTRASLADGKLKALIYGEFNAATASQLLTVNGRLGITTAPAALPVQLHQAAPAASAGTTLQSTTQRLQANYWSGAASVAWNYDIAHAMTATTPASTVTHSINAVSILKLTNTNTVPSAAFDGKLGVGVATAAAWLHLAAGTATANTAPLKLTTGVVLAAPEAGAIEYTTPRLYYTDGGTVRQTLVPDAYGNLYEESAGSNITVTTAATYYKWATSTAGVYHLTTLSAANDNITVDSGGDGDYEVSFHVSFSSDNGGRLDKWAVFVDGVKQSPISAATYVVTADQVTTMSATGLITLAAGQVVDLRVTSDADGDVITVTNAGLTVSRIAR